MENPENDVLIYTTSHQTLVRLAGARNILYAERDVFPNMPPMSSNIRTNIPFSLYEKYYRQFLRVKELQACLKGMDIRWTSQIHRYVSLSRYEVIYHRLVMVERDHNVHFTYVVKDYSGRNIWMKTNVFYNHPFFGLVPLDEGVASVPLNTTIPSRMLDVRMPPPALLDSEVFSTPVDWAMSLTPAAESDFMLKTLVLSFLTRPSVMDIRSDISQAA